MQSVHSNFDFRGYVDVDDTSFYELGEEEALCLTKLVLPYLNDLLRKLKALLSGDPATTMKVNFLLLCGCNLSRYGAVSVLCNKIFTHVGENFI